MRAPISQMTVTDKCAWGYSRQEPEYAVSLEKKFSQIPEKTGFLWLLTSWCYVSIELGVAYRSQ